MFIITSIPAPPSSPPIMALHRWVYIKNLSTQHRQVQEATKASISFFAVTTISPSHANCSRVKLPRIMLPSLEC